MSAEQVKLEKKKQSPYWMGRHKKGFLGSLAVVGIAAAAGFSAIGINRQEDTAAQGSAALKHDQACLAIIKDRALPGAKTATVSMNSLTPGQQVDCRLNSLPSRMNVGDGYGSPRLPVTIINSTVELPSEPALEAAITQDVSDSNADKYSEILYDAPLGGLAVPTMVVCFTAMASGDALVFSRRVDTPHREQTTISAQ